MKKLNMEELGRMRPEDFKTSPKLPVIVVLDNVRSLLNVGSIFRSGDAFGIEKIILSGYTGTPPHPEIRKTALGATDTVAWEKSSDLLLTLRELKAKGWTIAAIEQTTESLSLPHYEPNLQVGLVLILGNEVEGVQDEALNLCDLALEIPQFGTKHSLNVSVAAGIVLYALKTKLS